MSSRRAARLEADLEALDAVVDREDLVARWHDLYTTAPPKNISSGLLKLAIGYRMQEKACGGLRPATRRYLQDVVASAKPDRDAMAAMPKPPDQVKPGTRLIRQWHGKVYEAVVEADGVTLNGERFGSLSQAALAITGVSWSGPRFFGLKTRSAA